MTQFARSFSILLACAALVVAGCGGKDKDSKDKVGGTPPAGKKAPGGGSKSSANSGQDDPMQVLKAFLAAVRAKDKEKCLSLVHPENRDELKRDMERGFPPVPDSPQLQVTPDSGGNTATFTGVPALKNLKLKKHDGKWWIAD